MGIYDEVIAREERAEHRRNSSFSMSNDPMLFSLYCNASYAVKTIVQQMEEVRRLSSTIADLTQPGYAWNCDEVISYARQIEDRMRRAQEQHGILKASVEAVTHHCIQLSRTNAEDGTAMMHQFFVEINYERVYPRKHVEAVLEGLPIAAEVG